MTAKHPFAFLTDTASSGAVQSITCGTPGTPAVQTLHSFEPDTPLVLGLAELLALCDGAPADPSELLPFPSTEALEFRLANAKATTNDADRLMSLSAELVVYAGGQPFEWNAVDGFIRLHDIEVHVYAASSPPTGTIGGPCLALAGTADILGMPFVVSCDAVDGYRCHLAEATEATPRPTLGEVLTKISGGALSLPASVDFSVGALDLAYDPVFEDRYFLLRLDGHWPVLGDRLTLEDVSLEYQSSRDGPARERIVGELAVGDLRFIVAGRHDAEGWSFEGRTRPGDPIRIGDLLKHLKDRFELADAVVPGSLESLQFENIAVSYRDGGKSFSFCGEGQLEIDAVALDIVITVVIDHQPGAGTRHFSGVLTIGGQQFSVTLDDSHSGDDTSRTLSALYRHVGSGEAPDITRPIAALSADLARVVPPLKVPEVLFAYHRDHDAQADRSVWLFGIELDPMNLASGGLDLPVVSALFGDHLSFSVEAIQVLATNHAIPLDLLATMTAGTTFRLPAAALDSACISADIHLGPDTYPKMLALPPPAAAPVAPSATAPAAAGAVSWTPVHKQVSVLYIDKIGARYTDGRVGLLLGASLTASGLTLSLIDFGVSSPLGHFEPHFELSGLGLAYSGGSVEVSGSFLRTPPKSPLQPVQYSGTAMVKAASFTLSAMGSYASLNGHPSMFVFAFLDSPLGGPPCFFVTGLAAGFGYNRSLRLPEITGVAEFPLVKAVTSASGNPFAGAADDPSQALSVLDKYIEPAQGTNWLAVGVRFTSFEVVQSFALLSVTFGTTTEWSLLGLSTLSMPAKPVPGVDPIGFAQLALQVHYSPQQGVFAADAQLTAESYILSKACHLTGGFAFHAWLLDQPDPGGARAGDFVLCLGGYHPRFAKPAHYPDVAPVGFNWVVDDVTIKGAMYLAVTPAAVMAGGSLDAVWASGGVRAWFLASADFLLSWKPFHYDIAISIDIGASFTVDLWITSFTMTIHVGVDLKLWGPPFGGTAHVDLSVISFTVPFGSSGHTRTPIAWSEFRDSFLPPVLSAAKGTASTQIRTAAVMPAVMSIPTPFDGLSPIETDSYCFARIARGLTRDAADGTPWIVNGSAFELVIQTVIPAKTATVFTSADAAPTAVAIDWTTQLGVCPADLGAAQFESQLWLAVVLLDKAGNIEPGFDVLKHTRLGTTLGNVPKSIWAAAALGASGDGDHDGDHNSASALNGDTDGGMIANALLGVSLTPHLVEHTTPRPVNITDLQNDVRQAVRTDLWSSPKLHTDPPASIDRQAVVASLASRLAITHCEKVAA